MLSIYSCALLVYLKCNYHNSIINTNNKLQAELITCLTYKLLNRLRRDENCLSCFLVQIEPTRSFILFTL